MKSKVEKVLANSDYAADAIIDIAKNLQYFSFRSSAKTMVIASQNLGHAMTIAKSLKLGPCIIQVLDQKDGTTMYVQQFLQVKTRQAA